MRTLIGLTVAACAAMPSGVAASVSDDLVFCSKLGNTRERIACYDAAARIAANTGGAASIIAKPSLASAPVAQTHVPHAAGSMERRPFHGPYVALGGSYGVTAPISFGVFDDVSFFSGRGQPAGPSALAMAGFNLQYGHFVTSLELSGRFGRERFSDSQLATVNGGEFGIIGQSFKTYQFNADASAHVSLRAGLAVENTLIYGRLGVGAGHISESSEISTLATRCTASGFDGTRFICTSRAPIAPTPSSSTSRWLPSVLFGLGVEQNFGPFFARIEGQAEALRGPNLMSEWLWGVRGIGAIGFRF